MKNSKKIIYKIVISALMVALGLLLPFLTGQIPQIGRALLPMHYPVFITGLLLGWKYGAIVGFIIPLYRSLVFHMPVIYPDAVSMAVELCVYGAMCGLVFSACKKKNIVSLYISLISAMLCGRAAWGLTRLLLLGVAKTEFSLGLFLSGAFLNALPGIVIQLILIPPIVYTLRKTPLYRHILCN